MKSLYDIGNLIENEKEMKELYDDLFSFIITSKGSVKKQVNQFESQYKSFILSKIGYEYLDKNQIIKIINQMKERKDFGKSEIYWIQINEFKYESKFEFIIPTFKPEDILGLFLKKYIDEKKKKNTILSI